MRRITYCCTVGAIVLFLAVARTPSQTEPPPKPDDEWTQEQWPDMPPGVNPPMDFGGGRPPRFGEPPADFQRRMAEMQGRMEEMQRQAEEQRNRAIRQALRATDEQWRRMKPRLDRIERLKAEAEASIDPGSFGGASSSGVTFGDGFAFGGGWVGGFGAAGGGSGRPGQNWRQFRSWSTGSPSASRNRGEPSRGDILCQELWSLLQNPGAPAAEVSQKVVALRQAREQARRKLVQERQQLRAGVNPRQDATLILMGYLD
jgi:hypothetical protein